MVDPGEYNGTIALLNLQKYDETINIQGKLQERNR